MALLGKAVWQRQDFLINELMRYGYFKTSNGRQLYELNLSELEAIHIQVKSIFGKQLEKGE
ncbi:Fur-regulated basic protein FbpA [Priestia megaterium]|uniref:Fur-regulated basic protein FbpA n=1 Tax=Priestia megaterium TaxID=1404 RepID=UPI0018680E19|nr:Fur-regulated basic protein FbpA [Priestia megaterium]MBE2973050.1 Fur-regulated basic protein FbpA [Priestia megaterium]